MKTKAKKQTKEKDDHGKSQAKAQLESIVEMMDILRKAIDGGTTEERGNAEQRIQESPLEVVVREDWREPGKETDEPTEFKILLCTGGPAVRIFGDLTKHNEPDAETVQLQYQDWGTPWTCYDLTDDERWALADYARQFYFGG